MIFRYSTISDFHKCGAYFEHKHVKGLSDGIELSADVAFGTCVHLAVQDLFEGGDGTTIFAEYWTLQKEKPLQYSRYKWDELLVIGMKLIQIFQDEHMKHFKAEHLEKQIMGSIGPHAFKGTIDFVGTYKGIPSVVDWKTAAYPYDQYKLIYNEQLYGYVHLAEQGLGFKAEQCVYGVAVKDAANPRWQFRKAAVTQEKMQNVLVNISAVCQNISTAKQFIKNPGQCVVGKRVCPFFNRCHLPNEAKDGSTEETS